jgi:hypothetical protein
LRVEDEGLRVEGSGFGAVVSFARKGVQGSGFQNRPVRAVRLLLRHVAASLRTLIEVLIDLLQ